MTNPLEMTGLELLQGIVAGYLSRSAMAETIPMTFQEVDTGFVKIAAAFAPLCGATDTATAVSEDKSV